jgi:large subunit ribosomal protein L15
MALNKLTSITKRDKKRVGRGYGSGKGGHTATRGAKGQKARSKLPLYFEGTAMRKSLIRRMPMLRGKLRFKSFKQKPLIVNLKYLNLLPKGTKVTVDSLIKHGLVPQEAKTVGVKILGDGELKHALQVALPVSQSAAKKITKAGGKIISPDSAKPAKKPAKPVKKKTVVKKAATKKAATKKAASKTTAKKTKTAKK